jgi:hypothetical protein
LQKKYARGLILPVSSPLPSEGSGEAILCY